MIRLTSLVYVRRVRDEVRETLMIHKRHGRQRGKWNGLGGTFEPGERPEDCARREAREEAGIELEHLDFRGLLSFPTFPTGTRRDPDLYAFVFVSEAFRGTPRPSEEGELAWVDDAAMADLELYEGDRVFLPWLDRERRFSAVFRYEDGAFAGHEVDFYT